MSKITNFQNKNPPVKQVRLFEVSVIRILNLFRVLSASGGFDTCLTTVKIRISNLAV